jgi:CRP/FNR family transcriptional regulator
MLSPKEKVQLVCLADILEPLSEEQVKAVHQWLPETHLKQGQTFYTPEDRGEGLFLVKSGRVRIYKLDPTGRELTLAVVGEGTIFGEMALTAQRLRGAYAEAIEPTVICTIKREEIERLVRENPEVGLKIISILSERVQMRENQLEDISLKSIPARLASLILRLAESEGVMSPEGIKIPTHYTHEQLANMIASSRVSVTKAFAQLQDGGVVELRRRHIHVKDIEVLERVAGRTMRG